MPESPHLSLRTTQPTHFGQGWISGVLSVLLGILGLGAVFCFHFPSVLTMPELRELYPVPWIRALLHIVLAGAFLLGAISVCLRYNKALGLTGMGLTLAAWLLGGSGVSVDGELRTGPFLGLDWLLLNVIGYSVVFVPLERLFPLRSQQSVFRRQWRVDLIYFAVSALIVQGTTLLTMKPAMIFFDWARNASVTQFAGSLPFAIQFILILVVSDFTQYWVHRLFHVIPALWRFHAIHHSADVMDWLAGSRLHLVDAVVTRAISYVPIYVLGFSESAMFTYVAWVVIQATFIHANVRWEFPWLRPLLATPAFHHWHHSAAPEAVDKNFAVHLPALDWIFGSYYLPERWPDSYGIAGGPKVPEGFLGQLAHPFTGMRGNLKG
ncbi:MAG: sterol desaturase family protein [Candidatus Solibacter usitatus]|nr:sterol desaturase family protein [Candidatus Solibacter usitatus]